MGPATWIALKQLAASYAEYLHVSAGFKAFLSFMTATGCNPDAQNPVLKLPSQHETKLG